MTNTVAQAESWGRRNPTRDGGSWSGWCASLCWRSLEDSSAPSFTNATRAGDASDIQSNIGSVAPRGAFHYWGNGDGHVATDLDGGGTRLMMASNTLQDVWGNAIGTVSLDFYQRNASGHVTNFYRGWAYGYGPTRYADTGSSGTAGGGNRPIPNEQEDDDMGYYFYADPAAAYGYWNESRGACRLLTKEEWDWRSASASTAGGAPLTLVQVSSQWYSRALALGQY